MSNNYEKATEFIAQMREIAEFLSDNRDLIDIDNYYTFTQYIDDLEKNTTRFTEDGNILRIGIIGAVKAGKSSFLNACIFDGDDVLPKACTPMTAALTKISYSPVPKALVHFYSENDWKNIEEKSQEYDQRFNEAYDNYCEKYDQAEKNKADKQDKQKGLSLTEKKMPPKLSAEQYRTEFDRNVPESLRACKELTSMAEKNGNVLSAIGSEPQIIEGNVTEKLEDYVGANGKYTPIVSYVELQINNEKLEGIEIIDTPGMNDPVVSRGNKTKEFLSACDVAILLSPSFQFMDAATIRLMINTLPSASIRDYLVVGSKFDSGVLDYPKNSESFGVAWKKSEQIYIKQYDQNVDSIIRERPADKSVATLKNTKPLFISSMFYTMSKKIKDGKPFSDEEKHIDARMKERFKGYDEYRSKFKALSGIVAIRGKLNEFSERKIEIINSKNDSLISDCKINLMKCLDKIIEETTSSKLALEKGNVDELRAKYEAIRNVLDSARTKLGGIFAIAANESRKIALSIKSKIDAEAIHHQNIKTSTETHEHTNVHKTGLFGLSRKVVITHSTTHKADTAQVINNIASYIANCNIIINDDFNHIINKESISRKVKEVVLNIFDKAEVSFDESDILIPLDILLSQLEIPELEINGNKHLDAVRSQFTSGYASNNEIHKLAELQSSIIINVGEDIKGELDQCVAEIAETLTQKSVSFADDISVKLGDKQGKLQQQMAERELFIQRYSEFSEFVKQKKSELSKMSV